MICATSGGGGAGAPSAAAMAARSLATSLALMGALVAALKKLHRALAQLPKVVEDLCSAVGLAATRWA